MRLTLIGIFFLASASLNAQTHEFKPLPYATDALEPYIDSKTMDIHYNKHHRGYYDKFMAAIADNEFLKTASMPEIFARMNEFSPAVRNNGGGYWNHEFFWESMSSDGGAMPEGKLKEAIISQFGSLEKFQIEFKSAGLGLFGSGWVWLIAEDGKLKIVTTPNQDNPLMNVAVGQIRPLLALDVWEHAYYLKYQNRRADYIDGFFQIINWKMVDKRFSE